jgi:hypothetical protein
LARRRADHSDDSIAIAIVEALDGKVVDWLEHVSDAQ